MTRSLLLLSALVLPAAPAPKPPPYFVTQRGARLVYQEGDAERVLVVTEVEDKGGAKVVSVDEVRSDGQTTPHEIVAVSEKSLVRFGLGEEKFNEPWFIGVKLPFTPGDTWDLIEGVKATSVGEEVVTVAAGKWRAIRVDYEVSTPTGARRFSYWYGPGVGVIKVVRDGKERRVLKSFTPGKPDSAKP